jgi:hypothetical protein
MDMQLSRHLWRIDNWQVPLCCTTQDRRLLLDWRRIDRARFSLQGAERNGLLGSRLGRIL